MNNDSKFSTTIDNFLNECLAILNSKTFCAVRLKDLSKLQMVKNVLDKFEFLNMVYNENYKKKFYFLKFFTF